MAAALANDAGRQSTSVGDGGHDIPEEAEPIIGLLSRHMTTPDVARELARIWYETDIRDVLRSVRVPTLHHHAWTNGSPWARAPVWRRDGLL